MRRSFWLGLIALSITFNSLAQVSFKKGHYIDKQGNKTECFIKDEDWRNSPSSFNFKATESGPSEKMNTDEIQEFSVGDSKYIHANVRYDQSSQELKKLGVASNPDWIQADLLLRVVVEGKANLYHYNVPSYSQFFLSVDGSPIELLVFRNYLNMNDMTTILANRMYLSQLNGKVKCADHIPVNDKQVPYQLKPLAKHFREFNICSGGTRAEEVKKPKSFSIRLTPGMDFSKASAIVPNGPTYDFGSSTNFRVAIDFQFALPFNHGKWAIMAEPTYHQFKNVNNGKGLEYSVIEFPVGIRHRFFLSGNNYIFINGMAFLDFTISHDQILSSTRVKEIERAGSVGTAVGAGVAVGRFSIEGRYYPERGRSDGSIEYKYTRSSVIVGFRLTRNK